MPEKDPTTWSTGTWAIGFLMAIGGGFVDWYARFKSGHTRSFDVFSIFAEIFTSGFVGISVFFVLTSMNMSMGICAAGAGIGGHMGARLLIIIERFIEERIERYKDK